MHRASCAEMTMSGYSPSGGNVRDWMVQADVSMVSRIAEASFQAAASECLPFFVCDEERQCRDCAEIHNCAANRDSKPYSK